MPCEGVNHGATLFLTGVASLINCGGGSSIPELLNNLQCNTLGLCSSVRWHNVTHYNYKVNSTK